MDYMGTEIRTFYSLREIDEAVNEQIKFYKNLVEDYSEWLGQFLRNYEEAYGDEEWFKKLAALGKTVKTERKPKKMKKKSGKKGKGKASSSHWIEFREILLSASEQGEAEILFEAIEKLNEKIEQLEKVKAVVENLEKVGLGRDILYITYINEGAPEKIVLKHKKGEGFDEKFKFIADFSVSKELNF